MKQLWTILKSELKMNENIWITTQDKFNSNDSEWWKFEEFKHDEFEKLFSKYNTKHKVVRYWHEDGLCIILK